MTAPRAFEAAFEIEERGGEPFAQLDGFGGYTLGCATLAVARGVEGLSLHALHTCFVRPVPTDRAVALRIETISQGRRFARRRLEIREEGKLQLDLIASFAVPSLGPEFSDAARFDVGRLPPPDDLPSEHEVAEAEGWTWEDGDEPIIEIRWCGRPWALEAPAESSLYHAWVRPVTPPASDAGRVAGIAFTSDYHSHWPVARKRGGSFDTEGFTSLDQVVWIHRDDAWDDWWLLSSWTDQGHAGRSLGHRSLRTRDGRLVASMAQESLVPGATPRSDGPRPHGEPR